MPKLTHTFNPKIHSWISHLTTQTRKLRTAWTQTQTTLQTPYTLTETSLINTQRPYLEWWVQPPALNLLPPWFSNSEFIQNQPPTCFNSHSSFKNSDLKLKHVIAKSLPLSFLSLSLVDNFKHPLILLPRAKVQLPFFYLSFVLLLLLIISLSKKKKKKKQRYLS